MSSPIVEVCGLIHLSLDLHGLGFIHGDLKFNNILCIIGSTAFIKVIDYGCSLPYKNQKIFLNYDIGAMPYRVPEVLLRN
jgi:serine/threonine protein kinase